MTTETKGFTAEFTAPNDDVRCELIVTHNGKEIVRVSDDMAPEDAIFLRDLDWIPGAIRTAYKLGREDMACEMIDSFCKGTSATGKEKS